MTTEIYRCRICDCDDLLNIIDLGNHYIGSYFPKIDENFTLRSPLVLCKCQNKKCELVQLRYTFEPDQMYKNHYGYRSGLNKSMVDHLELFNKSIREKIELNIGDCVLDIGSNDSTFLQFYPDIINKYGIDPTGLQFKEYYPANINLTPDYFSKSVVPEKIKFKIITCISMLYDLPKPCEFISDVYEVLDNNGLFVSEQSYLLSMLEKNSFDTICHEHLEYYSFKTLSYMLNLVGFVIIDIEFNDCNGGSIRLYCAKKTSTIFKENTELCNLTSDRESKMKTFQQFANDIEYEKKKLLYLIESINMSKKTIYLCGASTKGNTLLQYYNLTSEQILCAGECNPDKFGRITPGTKIKIISEKEMRDAKPDFLLVLPWHFKAGLLMRENQYLVDGGQIIFPLPHVEIYSLKKKILITGASGQIGSYLTQQYLTTNDMNIYGSYAHKIEQKKYLQCKCNFLSNDEIKLMYESIKPDILVNLAAITYTMDAVNNITDTININGLSFSYLMELILKNDRVNSTFIINTLSSELYRGHYEITINEGDLKNEMIFPVTPYSIGKMLSFQIAKYYEKTYNFKISNCVLFTVESPLRREIFLLKKIANHISKIKQGSDEILKLGSLNNYRNFTHAYDIASALSLIIKTGNCDDFILCSDIFVCIKDVVIKMYEKINISLFESDNFLIDKKTNKKIIEQCAIENIRGGEKNGSKINGTNDKIKNLSWDIKYSTIDNIIDDLL